MSDTDEFRYATMRNPGGEGELAGIMDAAGFLPDGVPSHWSVYWEVDNVDGTVANVIRLGGSVVMEAGDTPCGRWRRSRTRREPSSSCAPHRGRPDPTTTTPDDLF